MNRHNRLIRYNDLLVIILIVLIGVSLFLTAFFATQFLETSGFSEVERVSYRNQLVQLQLENRIITSRQRLQDVTRTTGSSPSSEDLAEILGELNGTPGQLTGTEWRLLDSAGGELLSVEDGRLLTRSTDPLTLPWQTETAPERFPFLTLYRKTSGEIPRGTIVFGPDSAIAERYYALLMVDLNSIVELLKSEVSIPMSASVLNWAGNQLLEACLVPTGVSEIHTDWVEAGFADVQEASPYLGVMNLYLGQSATTQALKENGTIHSLIPLPAVDASIILSDTLVVPAGVIKRPVLPIVIVGLALYALIVALFVSYRRTVVGQTRRLNELSEQKNLLFSLLSHNLKNNLAAIAAEAQDSPSNHRVLAPVADASRVISNSLYYLQFQEQTFTPPPLESVMIDDLVEFLTLRCSNEAAAKSQTLRVGAATGQPMIQTNLTMALEALERILVNAIQYSPDASDISVGVAADETTASIVIGDQGPGLPPATIDVYQQPRNPPVALAPLTGKSLRGVGIYVARRILETLGATLHLVETGSGGTRISIDFPRNTPSSLTHAGNPLSIK